MFLASLYQTLFCTTYFGLLRVSEVTKGEHPVLARDVHIGTNKKKFLLILRTSKTHGLGTSPQMVKIPATNMSKGLKEKPKNMTNLPCPYKLLNDYEQRRGKYASESEPFFIFADKTPVTP